MNEETDTPLTTDLSGDAPAGKKKVPAKKAAAPKKSTKQAAKSVKTGKTAKPAVKTTKKAPATKKAAKSSGVVTPSAGAKAKKSAKKPEVRLTNADGSPKPYKMYGIARIDQPEKKNHGYYVRMTGVPAKFFPDKSNGGKNKALTAAQAHRDEVFPRLSELVRNMASKQRKVRSKAA